MRVLDIGSKSEKPRLLLSHVDLGREVWVKWEPFPEDKYDGLYGLYASVDCDDQIGEAETITEAREMGRAWFKELMES